MYSVRDSKVIGFTQQLLASMIYITTTAKIITIANYLSERVNSLCTQRKIFVL